MNHPLEQLVRAIKWRRRAFSIVGSAAIILSMFLIGLVIVCLSDFLLRWESVWARLILLSALAGFALLAAVGTFRRWRRVSLVQTALEIEHEHPKRGSGLASSIEFLRVPSYDAFAGSPQLRQQVIATATHGWRDAHPREFVDSLPLRRALAILTAVVAAAGAIALVDLGLTQTALARIFHPFQHRPWPRVNHLVLDDVPEKMARGANFRVELYDKNHNLPSAAMIHFRYRDSHGKRVLISRPMERRGDRMTATWHNVMQSFDVWATGGDDQDMEPQTVEVVIPPRVSNLNLTLVPPGYTRLPARSSGPNVEAFYGTAVRVLAEFDQPLLQSALKTSLGETWPMEITQNELRAKLSEIPENEWRLSEEEYYWIAYTDRDGIECGSEEDSYPIRIIRDQPPTVEMVPAAEPLLAAANASIPMSIRVEDNLAVQEIQLRYHVAADESANSEISVFEQKTPPTWEAGAYERDLNSIRDRISLEYTWDLSSVSGIEPGDRLAFYATATDFQPAEGRSASREVRIVTTAELQSWLEREHEKMVTDISRIFELQRKTSERTSQWRDSLTVEVPDEPRALTLASLTYAQRNVKAEVINDQDGVVAAAAHLQRIIRLNRIDASELTSQLEMAVVRLDSLATGPLASADQLFTQLEKRIAEGITDGNREDLNRLAAESERYQQEAAAVLRDLLAQLTKYRVRQGLADGLLQIRESQQSLHEATKDYAKRRFSRYSPTSIAADQERARLANEQNSLAEQLDSLLERFEEMPRAAEADGFNADAYKRHISDSLLVQRMREAAGQIQSEALGRAVNEQDSVLRRLDELQRMITSDEQPSQGTANESRSDLKRDGDGDRRELLTMLNGLLNEHHRIIQSTKEIGQEIKDDPSVEHLERPARLSGRQRRVGAGVVAALDLAAGLPVVVAILQDVASAMAQAADRLSANDLGQLTQRRQSQAERLLQHVISSLSEQENSNTDLAADGQPNQDTPSEDAEMPLTQIAQAELRLIRRMQEDIKNDFQLIRQATTSESPLSDQQLRLEELSVRQQFLAELVREALRETTGRSPPGESSNPSVDPLLNDLPKLPGEE